MVRRRAELRVSSDTPVLIYVSPEDSNVHFSIFFFLMIRRPPRSTLDRSSAASDVYKRQRKGFSRASCVGKLGFKALENLRQFRAQVLVTHWIEPVSYTHLRAHETVIDLVCRLLLEKKKRWL